MKIDWNLEREKKTSSAVVASEFAAFVLFSLFLRPNLFILFIIYFNYDCLVGDRDRFARHD